MSLLRVKRREEKTPAERTQIKERRDCIFYLRTGE
jgi:hypothetical protein